MGRGDRLTLCLHGFPELGFSWRHQLPLLASLGYRVWAPDLRGYGRTDRPQGLDAYAIERLMEDVSALIDSSGASETTLIAHDWGAVIAWQFAAARARDRERLVILNGPPPGGGPNRPSLFSRQFWRMLYVFFFQIPWLPERVLAARDYRMIEEVFRGSPRHSRSASRTTSCAYTTRIQRGSRRARRPDRHAQLLPCARSWGWVEAAHRPCFPVIETPTLLIWGEQDPILPPDIISDAGTWVADLTVHFVPNAGRWVQQEAPETVNSILEAWLTGQALP